MSFETQYFHVLTNNNWDRNLWIEALLSLGDPSPPPLKKIKFFIYDAILLKFETEHFHVFTNNDFVYNL